MNRKRLLIGALVLVAAAAGVAGYSRWSGRPQATSELVLYGNIDIREVALAFNNEGRVENMLAEEGDRAREGQLLATLEDSRYKAEVAAAEARVAAQSAILDRYLAGSRPEEIAKARADARAIEAELADARATLGRTLQLVQDKFAPLQRLDDHSARVRTLEAQLGAAHQALALALEGPRKEDIAAARAQLGAENAALTLAREYLKDTKLYAKGDGVVRTRIVEPGAVVLAHAPVYTIALSDPVWVRTYVAEPDLGRIRPGMKAAVFTDSEPEKAHEGQIGFISPVAEFTPKTVETPDVRTSLVYRIRVYVKNADGSLRQGMPVTVRITPGPGRG